MSFFRRPNAGSPPISLKGCETRSDSLLCLVWPRTHAVTSLHESGVPNLALVICSAILLLILLILTNHPTAYHGPGSPPNGLPQSQPPREGARRTQTSGKSLHALENRMAGGCGCREWLGVLERIFIGHVFPQAVLMQPNWIRIPGDELVSTHTINHDGTPEPFLFSIDENRHEFLSPFLTRSFLRGSEFSLTSCHQG